MEDPNEEEIVTDPEEPPKPGKPARRSHLSRIQKMNIVIAFLAGIISITGGVYSFKARFLSDGEHGSVQGIVRDARITKPLQLVSVAIKDTEAVVVNTIKTNADGYYKAKALKPGKYTVTFTAPLHRTETETIKIEKGITATIDMDLFPEEPEIKPPAPVPPKTTDWKEIGMQIFQDWLKKQTSPTRSRASSQ